MTREKQKLLIGCFNKSVILTYIGVGCVVLGTFGILNDNWKIGMICMVISGICDMLDGTVARMCTRTDIQKRFGMELDSLADVVSFGYYPILVFVRYCGLNYLTLLISMVYLISGINRLCWFNISEEKGIFRGIPITSGVLGVVTVYVIGLMTSKEIAEKLMYIAMVFMGVFFSVNIKIPKPGKRAYTIFGGLAILYIGVILIR